MLDECGARYAPQPAQLLDDATPAVTLNPSPQYALAMETDAPGFLERIQRQGRVVVVPPEHVIGQVAALKLGLGVVGDDRLRLEAHPAAGMTRSEREVILLAGRE